MKSTHTPRSGFRSAGMVIFAGILSLTLCAGQSFTEELSEFEKLLKEAIQSNQEENAAKVKPEKRVESLQKTAEKDFSSSKPVKNKEEKEESGVAKTITKTIPAIKPKKLDGGWEAVKPNDLAKMNSANERVLVADTAGTAASKTAANASVWDAEPETVPQKGFETADAENVKQNAEEKPNSNSLWDTVTESKKKSGAAETEFVAVEETVEETAEPKKLVDIPKEKPQTGEVEEDTVSEVVPEVVETVKAEQEPEEKPVEVAVKKEEKKTSGKTIEPNSDIDISSILNILAKDKGSETEKKEETPKQLVKTEPEEVSEKPQENAVAEKTTEKSASKEDLKPKTAKNQSKEESAEIVDTVKSETVKKKAEKTEKTQPEEVAVETKTEKKPDVQAPAFDASLDEMKWVLVNPDSVGDPFGKEKLKLMYDEVMNGLKTRGIAGRYDMWKNYARSTLRNTAGINTGSELDGRCRLEWYKHLYDDPIKSVFEADEFTRRLHHGLSGSHRHILESISLMRKKMDVADRNDDGVRFIECKTPFDAVNEIKRCLINAQMGHSRYLSPLTSAEKSELVKGLVATFAGTGCVNGHTVPSRTYGRRLTDIIEKTDKTGLYDAAESLIPLTNTALLALLDKLPEDAFPTTMISGQKVQRLYTPAGDIIIGGRENNVYDLDSNEMKDVVCIIDLGGNDTYRDGTCNIERPVLAVIDLHGNDIYTGSKPGIQGGSVLGFSILVDAEGDDTYSAGDVAQGSSIGGFGMLFDFAGKDSYKGLRRVQGHALHGLGVLVDRKGHDNYHAAMWAQGFGAPGGFGVLEDTEGDDHYYCGGLYLDSYPEHPGYDGWGQGVGAGIRQVANGGIGAILEGGGNDIYEVDYFGHGGGYWLGVGFARDFGGNDIRHGTTKTAYSGGPRQQQEWTRFANGFGCHYSLGYCFDDGGDDVYGGRIMGTGMAWDLSIGYLCDFNGNDKFTATGGMTQGVGAEGSIGILFNYGGNDQFLGRNQGYASSAITYHQVSNCGGNISFVINYGGNDQYGCGAKNNTYVQRGSQGGFLIDRPTDNEAAEGLIALKEMIEKREREIAEYDEAVTKAKEEAAAKGRRYYPRQRRPMPISADQQSQLGSVPDFNAVVNTVVNKADTEKKTVK